MLVDEFDYDLPQELFAREPPEERGVARDGTRLLVLHRQTNTLEHSRFCDIGEFLDEGDTLVLNNSRTVCAELPGERETGGKVWVRLCSAKNDDCWVCTLKPDGDITPSTTFRFGSGSLRATVVERRDDIPELWILRFTYEGEFFDLIERIGRPVLSPYTAKAWDIDAFQTVYATRAGSAEMPAAGRHFSAELLSELSNQGIHIAYVTLHTGLSSVSVKEDTFEEHTMYEERFEVSPEAAAIINATKARGKRVIAVGTTSVRVLETVGDQEGRVHAMPETETSLYVLPGYRYKVVDALVTNFHSARSSRMALVAAFAGKELTLRAYNEAIKEKYKFFEFGDATLTL